MTKGLFPRIGLFSKPEGTTIKETLLYLIDFLEHRQQHTLFFETETAALANITSHGNTFPGKSLGQHCDLIIVVGGDGSLLKAGRAIVDHNVPILGINRGNLGFMADIRPEQISSHLTKILDGVYTEDDRCLLHIDIIREGQTIFSNKAINDIVLYNGDMARLMEFEIFIDDQFVMHQRSDGIITATPTGSTAYSLSAGGPIIYPTLDAFTLVSLYPHTLTSRPIVIKDTSVIRFLLPNKKNLPHKIACDGQIHVTLSPNDDIYIKKHHHALKIIHPKEHNHFWLLRNKLGWSTYVGSDRFQHHSA